jgi:DNA-binding LytR/AlgR family response regulator
MRLVDINVFVKFRPALNGAVLSWSDSMNILVRKRPVSPAEYAQANDRTIQQPVRDPESPGGRPEPDRPRFLERMAVKLHDRIVIVRFQDVLWFQSKGNLLRLHLDQNGYDCRMTLKELLPRLDPGRFLRVDRGAIVNLDHVMEFDLPRHGKPVARFHNGSVLPMSQAGKLEVRRRLLCHSYEPNDE